MSKETITLDEEQLDVIEEVFRELSYGVELIARRENEKRMYDDIASLIEAQRSDEGRVEQSHGGAIGLTGLPGAGKSHLAKKLETIYETESISMGDAIRERAPDRLSSKGLAQWASEKRNEDPEQIPGWTCELASQIDTSPVIIDGVRSLTDYRVLNDYFDHFSLIEVRAPFYTRLDRLQERGREGEDKFTATDLAERDETERYELGQQQLHEETDSVVLYTDTHQEKLTEILVQLAKNKLPFEVQHSQPSRVTANQTRNTAPADD